MRRNALAALPLSLLLCATQALAQQERDWSKVEIKVTPLAGSVYLLQGEGGNIAASVGADGIAIVDDQFAPLAERIQAALKPLGAGDGPVRFVINTHFHFDHTGGNVPFAEAGATLLAQDNVRRRMAAGGTAGVGTSLSFPYAAETGAALPVLTFGESLTVHLNGEEIRATHLPAGHTDGDAIVFFPKANVVHFGDVYVRYGFPFIDVLSGGSVQGMIAGLKQAIADLPPDVKVVPGHGEVATLDDVRAYVKMLEDTTAAVRKAMDAGETLEQIQQRAILAPWREAWLQKDAFIDEKAFTETIYRSLAARS